MGLFKGLFGKKKDTFAPSTAEPKYDYLETTMATELPEPEPAPDDGTVYVPLTEPKEETHIVAGTSYREKEILSLAVENNIYDYTKKELIEELCLSEDEYERVYKYEFYPRKVEIEPEPDNEFDKNALKVIIDKVHVGYIKKGSCSRIKKLIKNHNIERIEADINGGPYKILSCEYDWDKEKEVYALEKDNSKFSIRLTFHIR